MVRRLLILAAVLGAAQAALAQSTGAPTVTSAPSDQAAAQAADPGRTRGIEQNGLASRGGANPANGNRVYFEAIGGRIYSAIGQPIATVIGPRG